MTVARHLEEWLTDPARQRRSRASADAFAQDWNEGPIHQRFATALEVLAAPSAEALADTVAALFADDGWVDALIGGLAAKLRADPFFDPPFRVVNSDVHSGLLVFEDERLSIGASVSARDDLAAKKNARRGATSIGFTGRISVIKFLKSGGARLAFWEAPPITAAFSAAAAGRCTPAGTRQPADGEILVVDGRHQSFVIEHARANLVLLQAEISLDRAPLSVEYDSASRSYVGCSAGSDDASRIQMITTLLRKLDCDAAVPTMAALLDHPDFFVRWHVMKEMLGLDAAASLPHLRRMAARDPHPEPRRAARAVLDRLDAPRSRRAA